MKTAEERFWEKVRRGGQGECWEWQAAILDTGYGSFSFNGKSGTAHRASWEIANGPIPDGLWVLHRCDNRKCVRPDHLFLGTQVDNMRDMAAKGRGVPPTGLLHWAAVRRGENVGGKNPNAKLDDAAVLAIKVGLAAGDPTGLVAHLHGVSSTTISLILTGQNWQHVPWPEGACFSVDCDTAKRSRGIKAANAERYGVNCADGCGRVRDGMRTRCAECWLIRRKASKTAAARLHREATRAAA